MGKRYKILNQFHGGLNDRDSARDIQANELVEAMNVMVDKVGRIRNMGSLTSHGAGSISGVIGTVDGGYGLHAFRTDQSGEENLLAVGSVEGGTAKVNIIEEDGTTVDNFSLGTAATFFPVFYAVEGKLRVADANFTSTAQPKWWGRIVRDHFNGDDSYDGWYAKVNDLAAPMRGIYGEGVNGLTTNDANSTTTKFRATTGDAFPAGIDSELDAGVYVGYDNGDDNVATITARVDSDDVTTSAKATSWIASSYTIFPPSGAGFNVTLTLSGTEGTWDADDYILGSTFVYENGQESKIYEMSGGYTVAENESVQFSIFAKGPYDPRIVGGRIYTRKNDSNDKWALCVDIDLEEGVRLGLDGEYKSWLLLNAANNLYDVISDLTLSNYPVDTYESINAFSPNVQSIAFDAVGEGYKTAVVANRRVFVANVRTTNVDGQTAVMGDKIMYTPVNRFDTFPTSYFLDLGLNDGDEFTALASYADRLYAFKKHVLYVINIASGDGTDWFVERVEHHRGVAQPSAVTQTEYGITWANYFGAFLDDGRSTVNLSKQFSDTSQPLSTRPSSPRPPLEEM